MSARESCGKLVPDPLLFSMVSLPWAVSAWSWADHIAELGRGTSTFDGMAIAGAVLHHLATHTLPLGFFAVRGPTFRFRFHCADLPFPQTHYGSLTDDYAYHPNIRNMHMQTHVDDEQRQVVFLYKLIPGVAESSHGTRKFP